MTFSSKGFRTDSGWQHIPRPIFRSHHCGLRWRPVQARPPPEKRPPGFFSRLASHLDASRELAFESNTISTGSENQSASKRDFSQDGDVNNTINRPARLGDAGLMPAWRLKAHRVDKRRCRANRLIYRSFSTCIDCPVTAARLVCTRRHGHRRGRCCSRRCGGWVPNRRFWAVPDKGRRHSSGHRPS